MNRAYLLFLTIVYYAISPVHASVNEWELFKHATSNDIQVYFREAPEHPDLVEFKGVTIINATLASLVAVIRDVKSMNEWVYLVQTAIEYERISHTESFTYIIHNSPLWGFDRRDSVVHSILKQDPKTLEVIIRGIAAPDKAPRNSEYERILSGKSQWKLTPLKGSAIRITFQGFANPGGMIKKFAFAFMVKNFLWKLPMETLSNLKSQVRKPAYRHASFEFIENVAKEDLPH